MTMDNIYRDELLRYGSGTKYHIYGLNIGLQNTNIGLQGTNIGLERNGIRKRK